MARYGKIRSILRQSFWAAAHLRGPVGRVIELVGHLRRPEAADVAVEQIALDRLAQPGGAAGAVGLPARREHERAAEREMRLLRAAGALQRDDVARSRLRLGRALDHAPPSG